MILERRPTADTISAVGIATSVKSAALQGLSCFAPASTLLPSS